MRAERSEIGLSQCFFLPIILFCCILKLVHIILPRCAYYSFHILMNVTHIIYSYNNDTTLFSLVEDDDKILLLFPSVASLGSFTNSDPVLGTTEVDRLLVLAAPLIATDPACVAAIFRLNTVEQGLLFLKIAHIILKVCSIPGSPPNIMPAYFSQAYRGHGTRGCIT